MRFKHEVPLDLYCDPKLIPPEPVTVFPAPRPKACNCGDMDCIACWDAGVRYADYEHNKRMEEL